MTLRKVYVMATSALKVPEKSARRLLKELNYSNAGSMTAKKLEKQLLEIPEGINGDGIEDLDLSSPSKSLLETVVEAVEEERDVKIIIAEVENDEEAEAEEEETPKKKGKTTKTKSPKTKSKKTPKVSVKEEKVKTKVKKKSSGASKEYQTKVHDSGLRVRKVIEKASKAMTIAEIAEKAKVTESRVTSHINYRNRGKENPPYNLDKKGRVSSAS
jgi:hypothetical protein